MQKPLDVGDDVFTPFRLVPPVDGVTSWFGGSAPREVAHLTPSIPMEHLLTLNWEANQLAVSCLVATDFSVILDARGTLHRSIGAADAIAICAFPAERPIESALHPSRYPRCGISFGLPARESDVADTETSWNHHKVGGCPFSLRQTVKQAWQEARREAFALLLQLSFPDDDDVPLKGSWPLGEYNLYVFAKPDLSQFAYLIDA